MSFNINNIKYNAALLFVAVGLFASCVELPDETGDNMGYLSYSSLDVDIALEEFAATKSVSLPTDIYEPDASDVTFKVTDCEGKEIYNAEGPWQKPLILPVGNFTVEATYGVNGFNTPGYYGKVEGTISAVASQNVTVRLALVNSLVAVSLSDEMKNHFILGDSPSVTFESGESKHTAKYGEYCFVPAGNDLKVTLSGTSSAGKPAKFTYTLTRPAPKTAYEVICKASSTNWPSITIPSASELAKGAFEKRLYFRPMSPSDISNMSPENAVNPEYEIIGGAYGTWTKIKVSTADNYNYITGLENVKYRLRARIGAICSNEEEFTPISFSDCVVPDFIAEHQYPGGVLSGTKVTAEVKVKNLPELIRTLSTGLAATAAFVNSEGAERVKPVASTPLAKDGSSAALKMENLDGWPYIPHGSHKLTVNAECVLPGGAVNATVVKTADVPEPSFSLSVKAYTTYDQAVGRSEDTQKRIAAITKNVSTANTLNAETIYDAGASWTISEDLMKNTNYSKVLKVIVDDAEKSSQASFTTNSWYTNISSLSWARHKVKTSLTFAGYTKESAEQLLDITGLPYKAPSLTKFNAQNKAWTKVDGRLTSVASDVITLRSQAGDVVGQEPEVNGPKFHIPANLKTSVTVNCNIHSQNVVLWYRCTLNIKVNETTIIEQESGKSKDNVYTLTNNNVTFTPSGNYIVMKTNVTAVEARFAEVSAVDVIYVN